MQSLEDGPMSSSKRPGVPLNVDTAYQGTHVEIDSSPPETPAAHEPRFGSGRDNHHQHPPPPPPHHHHHHHPQNKMAAAGRPPKQTQSQSQKQGQRQTFLDDITPVDPSSHYNKENNDPELAAAAAAHGHRDSHDLSISPRQVTRDSLVDHMLLSLDQFSSFDQEGEESEEEGLGAEPPVDPEQHINSMYASSSSAEGPSYQPTSNFAPRGPRPGHSYSYSSDYENNAAAADDSSRYSGQWSRSRRSNSSSTFQPGLGRINSIRNNHEGGARSFSSASHPLGSITPRPIHSRSGKGSKGSSANSVDLGYAQVTGSQRWAHGLAGRSSSFDYGRDRQSMTAQSDGLPRQNNNHNHNPPPQTSSAPYDYDAAPTPTVPGGPRRPRPVSPILIAQKAPAPADPGSPKLERRRSTKSSKSAYRGKTPGRVDYGLNDDNRELPPLPAFIREPAPSPTVAYDKTTKGSPRSPPTMSPQPAKERPGFFRRVFGSSKSNSPAGTPDPPRSHGSAASSVDVANANRPTSKTPHHVGTQLKAQHVAPLPREPPPTPKEHVHALTKKPSSFFRRRKKSVSEPPVPAPLVPAPPMLLQSELPLPSPVSSLRKVMNPYLRTPARSPSEQLPHDGIDRQMNDSPEELDRNTRGFSPDYEPDKSATIRTVRQESKDAADRIPSSSGSGHKPFLSAGGDGGTFLQDASDNDPDGHSNNSKSALNGRENLEPAWPASHLSPATPMSVTSAVARDMALVAEYERIHSKRSPTTAKFDLAKPSPYEPSKTHADSRPARKGSNSGKDEDWVMVTPDKPSQQPEKSDLGWSERSNDPSGPHDSNLELPTPAALPSRTNSGSTDTMYKSATSLPMVQVEHEEQGAPSSPQLDASEADEPVDEPTCIDPKAPTDDDIERAKKIYNGNEDFIQKEKAAAWMGEEGDLRSRVLAAYLELYDFLNLNILASLRIMCGRLVLKAESQQVDRILDAFAKRWCQCNPNHGFKVTDVVHTICYSILLLNTDLHLADIEQKMTRSQFVKNTMPTVRKSVAESAPDAFEAKPTVLPGRNGTFGPDGSKQPGDGGLKPGRGSVEAERPSWRSSFKPAVRAGSEGNGIPPTPLDYDTPVDDSGPLVKAPFHGTLRTWEVQVEIVLKDFYNSIRTERLPLFGAPMEKPQLHAPSTNSLNVFASGVLRRSPSVLSKTPSESQSYARGRTAETVRVGNGRWANKNRSRPRLYPGSGVGSSRTSLDDQSSMWSPSVSSSTWSKYSLGKTQTSMSVDSFGSSWPDGDYQQSIGFANALSQAIIREETIGSAGSNGSEQEPRVAPLLEDESLELHGAPWAKEGILKHKHHLESLDKKAKDRNWNEVFAVVEKGYLSLFSFSSKSMRSKSKGKAAGAVVGGGNWQENARSLGSFLLRQTIASALPPPGYSKARPHVWALSLPTGAVHLFQVGTPDIVKEFVSTANYWSARLSNHPLVGGISNIEYGWSDAIVNNALVAAINDSTAGRPSTSGARPSLQSSLRSSIDQSHLSGGVRARLPGDRIAISDWAPPTQSMRASNLMEADQLQTLQTYVAGIEEELQKHNLLRNPMLLAFTPRHVNSHKAMANWEKKSSYLLREIVKFRTYIDCLLTADAAKQRIYAERAAERAIAEKTPESDDDGDTTLRPE